jgi:glycosyltransferase involved in cell wall biosynthesis
MACGLPAVAMDAGGMADAVQEGGTGYLVGQEDIAGFSARIQKLLNDDALRVEMGIKARQLIEREFTSSIQANRFAALYGEILASRESRSA